MATEPRRVVVENAEVKPRTPPKKNNPINPGVSPKALINSKLLLYKYANDKSKVTLQVKNLEPTSGIRHLPENLGGESNKYITGILQAQGSSFVFIEDGKSTGQYIEKDRLSQIRLAPEPAQAGQAINEDPTNLNSHKSRKSRKSRKSLKSLKSRKGKSRKSRKTRK